MTAIAALQRFAVPGSVTIDAGCGGLPRVSIATPLCRAEFYLHGAHVTAWQPAGQAPVLWMSTQGMFAAGKPIRGGIPLCWPWFGASTEPGKPAHGVARLADWSLAALNTEADGTVVAVLRVALAEPAAELLLTARFGRRLDVELAATNRGSVPLPVGEALHTYLAVGDVRRVAVGGLAGLTATNRVGQSPPVCVERDLRIATETDLVFTGTTAELTVQDPAWNRTLRIAKRGSRTAVVWNPWVAKSAAMPDFGDHEWPGMICVEAANAMGDAYELAPGASHRLATVIEVL